MKKTNKKNYKYNLGSFIETNGANIGTLGTFAGQAIGGAGGNALSSAASGFTAGLSFGPIGAGIGAGLGLLGGVLGANKQQKQEEALRLQQQNANTRNYTNKMNSNLDTQNLNPYGNLSFALGGLVPTASINIEKGELQIDPVTGKILRKYDKINPETGGLYKEHSKGTDTKNNFVTAEPGTFIITKDKAKDYQKAIDTNDKLHQNSILQNIKNAKDNAKLSEKMALGSFVDPVKPIGLADTRISQGAPMTPISYTGQQSGFNKALGGLMNYAPSLLNIGQGLFGRVENQPYVNPVVNPYRTQVLNNLPQDISFDPIRKDLLRQQGAAFNQVRNSTNGSPIARANMNNIFANTNNQLGRLQLDNSLANNQVRGQRASIYAGLGSQDMQEQARIQQLNLGIDDRNMANRGAKQNLLSTGLGQLQQTYQNQNMIGQQKANDALKNKLLYEMFPNLRFYSETFGGQ